MQLANCLDKLSGLELLLVSLPIFVLLVLMYENVKLLKRVKELKAKSPTPIIKDKSDTSSLEEYVLDLASKGVESEQISEQLNISVSRVELIVKFNKLRD